MKRMYSFLFNPRAALSLVSVCFLMVAGNVLRAETGSFSITVKVTGQLKIDTLWIAFDHTTVRLSIEEWQYEPLVQVAPGVFTYSGSLPVVQGRFTLRTPVPKGSPWDGKRWNLPITPPFYWCAGDSIQLVVRDGDRSSKIPSLVWDYEYDFHGVGAEKYSVWDSLLRLRVKSEISRVSRAANDVIFPQIQARMDFLEQKKEIVGPFYYWLFKADLVGREAERVKRLAAKFTEAPGLKDSLSREGLPVNSFTFAMDSVAREIPEDIAYRVPRYINYQLQRLMLQNIYDASGRGEPFDLITQIAEKYSDAFRDRLLVCLFHSGFSGRDLHSDYQRVKALITDQDCVAALEDATIRLPGRPVLDFKLPDTEGKLVSLSDFRGKVVLIDLWFTGCGACHRYYKNILKPAEEALKHRDDIVFISVSADRGVGLWQKSVLSGKYTSADALNLNTQPGGFDHEWLKHYQIGVFPTLMVVNPSGTLYRVFAIDARKDVDSSEKLVSLLTKIAEE